MNAFKVASLLIINMSFSIANALTLDDLTLKLDKAIVEGQFSQVTYSAERSNPDVSGGQLLYSPPSKFRWHYLTPYEQLLIADGEKIWIYEPDLEQVTIKDQQMSGQTLMRILEDPQSLKEQYSITELPDENALLLKSKSEQSEIAQIILSVDEVWLKKIEMTDAYGQLTVIDFTVQITTDTEADNFIFIVPEDTDVIDTTSGNP